MTQRMIATIRDSLGAFAPRVSRTTGRLVCVGFASWGVFSPVLADTPLPRTVPLPGLEKQAKPADAGPTIGQFIKMRWPTSVDLAADGTLYFIFDPDGIRQLYSVAPGKTQKDARKLTTFVDGIGGYTLSEDGQWIAITAAKGGSEQTGLYLLDTATGTLKTLFEDPSKVYGHPLWRRDSKALAYKANDVSKADFYVYVYDLASGHSRRVFEQTGDNSPQDFSSPATADPATADLRLRDGGKLMAMKYLSASHSRLFEIDLASGDPPKSREVTPPDQTWSYESVGYGPDDRTYVVATNYGGDRIQLQALNLSDGKPKPVVTDFADHDIDFAVFNKDRTLMGVSVNEDGYGALHLRRYPDGSPMPTPPMAKGVVGNVRLRHGTLLYSLDNANTPGIVYASKPGQVPKPLTEADTQGIDVGKFALPELVTYKSFDGLDVPAFLYLPVGYKSEIRRGGKGEPIPFIINYHGGPEGQTRPNFNRSGQYFLLKGFGLLQPNVRGSSGYGMKFLEMDNYKNRMASVKDGVWAAKWLIEQGYSKPKLIGVWGGSYGGYMVMATITEAPELFGAACDVVGIVNMETFLQQTKDYRRKLREAEYGPLEDAAFLKSISPIYKVDQIDTPLLIAHGLNDPRVPVGEALQVANELRRRKKPVDLLIFPDEGHGFVKEPNKLLYNDTVAAFFEKYLRSGPPIGATRQ